MMPHRRASAGPWHSVVRWVGLAAVLFGAPVAEPGLAQPQGALSNWEGFPASGGLAAPRLAVPGAANPAVVAPPLVLRMGLEAQEAWSDNVYLVGSGQPVAGGHNSDVINILGGTIDLLATTRRLDLVVNYRGAYDWYNGNPQLDGAQHNGIATMTAALLEQKLFVDARANVNDQAVNPNGSSAAGSRSLGANENRETAYQIGPRWQEAIDDWMLTQLAAAYGQVFNQTPASSALLPQPFQPPNLANSSFAHGRAEARSSESFTQIQWILSTDDTETRQTGQNVNQVVTQLASEMRLNDSWGLLATIGDEHLRGDGLNPALSGLFYNAGLHWTPSPDTELRITDGRRANSPDLLAFLDYHIGARTVVRLARSIKVTNDPETLFNTLTNLQRDQNGTFIDPFSGLSASPVTSTVQLSNGVYRLQSSSVALTHFDPRDSLSLTARLDKQVFLSGPQTQISTLTGTPLPQTSTNGSIVARWDHRLTPVTTLSVSLSDNQQLAASPPGTKPKTLGARAGLTYQLNRSVSLDLNYRLNDTLQSGTDSVQTAPGRIKEDYLFVGLRKFF